MEECLSWFHEESLWLSRLKASPGFAFFFFFEVWGQKQCLTSQLLFNILGTTVQHLFYGHGDVIWL